MSYRDHQSRRFGETLIRRAVDWLLKDVQRDVLQPCLDQGYHYVRNILQAVLTQAEALRTYEEELQARLQQAGLALPPCDPAICEKVLRVGLNGLSGSELAVLALDGAACRDLNQKIMKDRPGSWARALEVQATPLFSYAV